MRIFNFFTTTKLTFVKKHHEKDDIYTLTFTPNKPLKQLAGQHSMFTIPGVLGFRIFSLASAPEEGVVMIGTHIHPESTFKTALGNLKVGDTITMHGPLLDFVFEQVTTDAVFLAQGIGITPFRSLLIHASSSKLPITTTLIHVDSHDHTYRKETEALATKSIFATSPETFSTAVIQTITEHPNAVYYVSGSPRFNKATGDTLMNAGVEPSQMKKDSFLGYTKKRKI